MRTFVCILKSGGDYGPEHAQILQDQVMKSMPSTERFLCLTDLPSIPNVETMSLKLGLRGKYSMMEVFRIPGEVVVTGLDTIMVGDLDKIWKITGESGPRDFWMIRSFNKGRDFANGIMAWNGNWSELIYDFNVRRCYGFRLEQEYTIRKLKAVFAHINVLNEHFTIKSFKHDYRDGDAKLAKNEFILFHGTPRPHEVELPWIQELYYGQ